MDMVQGVDYDIWSEDEGGWKLCIEETGKILFFETLAEALEWVDEYAKKNQK